MSEKLQLISQGSLGDVPLYIDKPQYIKKENTALQF